MNLFKTAEEIIFFNEIIIYGSRTFFKKSYKIIYFK